MTRDLRICFVGDSFVAGIGDPLCHGWAGRLTARTIADGQPLTSYNLGVRRQTSSDILTRWQYECDRRLQGGTHPPARNAGATGGYRTAPTCASYFPSASTTPSTRRTARAWHPMYRRPIWSR